MAKYSLPIEEFLVTKIQEHFPNFDVRQGTAFRDMVIKPLSVFMQPYRDQANVIKRNLSLENYEAMTGEEMDSLTSNVFVGRRVGTNSEGTVRLYLTEPVAITVTTDTQFQTSDGLIFNPKETMTFTAEEVILNVEGLFYFADVPAVAEESGTQYNIAAHSIVFISGGPTEVVKVDNLTSFSQGVDIEDNATLHQRAKESIAVRDLVIKKAISAVLLENFNTLREIAVAGYGDPEMQRDIITTVMDLRILLEEATTGEIANGDEFTDTTKNWFALGVQVGHKLVVLDSPDAGEYSIIQIVDSNTFEIDTSITNRTGIQYGIDGLAITNDFHIGGKVDTYIDSTGLEEKIVVLAPANEVNPVRTVDPGNYEGGIVFSLPVVGIKRIVEIDPSTREELATLDEGTDYVFETEDPNTRYSPNELSDITLLETNPLAPKYYIGSTLQVEYYADEQVQAIQTFMDNELNRVVTADMLCRRCVPTFVDLEIRYEGDAEEDDIENVVREFIDGVSIGADLEVSDIISTVYFFNVNFVETPMTIDAYTHNVDGTINHQQSEDRVSIPRTSKYVPRDITATKVT
jgi:hypothetical protein